MFNYRHRRVLESIFHHHPAANVTLHSNFLIQEDFRQFTAAGYSLRVAPLDFAALAAGTPLEDAERQPRWREWEAGPHWYTSFSNLYRLLLLWRHGGVYIDTDVVLTRPLHGLDRAIGFQDPARRFANNAVLVFKRPGNPFVWRSLVEIAANYSTKIWGQNGPALLTRVWRWWGDDPAARNAAVTVLDYDRFYLFPHSAARAHCFGGEMTPRQRAGYARALASHAPYGVHLSNKMTGNLSLAGLAEGTFCHYLLTRYCVFCEAEPRRPAAYPSVEAEGGELIELP